MSDRPPRYRLSVLAEADTYLELADALDAAADGLREKIPLASSSGGATHWRYAVVPNPKRRAVKKRK